jgi:hypothetical protein
VVFHRTIDAAPRRRGWRRGLIVCLLAFLAAAFSGSAFAELAQRRNIFIRFDGGITPRALPRSTSAPIAVRIEGTVRVLRGETPPALRRIRIALNRAGHLRTRGLPTCRRRQIDFATSAEALASCGTALVGSGGLVARTALPNQPATTVRADLLLFNGAVRGHPAVLAHVYQTRPVPITRIVVFEIRRGPGTFGTGLTARITPEIERNGYLKSIYLQLQRRYVFRGRRVAYLSAACSAPPGFTAATFPFARAAMTFADGRTLSAVLIRSCTVQR